MTEHQPNSRHHRRLREGRELERESLAYGEPARTAGDVEPASAGDPSEMLGEVLQSQELNPNEPAVTNDPVPLEGTAPAAAAAAAPARIGCRLRRRRPRPGAAGRKRRLQASPLPPRPSSRHRRPSPLTRPPIGRPTARRSRPPRHASPATASPHAAATAAAVQKVRKPLDPEHIFLICGMIVGAIIIVFGLCMLAYYTPGRSAPCSTATR